jgi:ubiquinone/menaquinone biosynthesis C-methylase UbiE
MTDQSTNIFDVYAEKYHAILSQSIRMTGAHSEYFSEYKVCAIKENVEAQTGSILDFGCGDGTTAFFFRNYFPRHKITGIDVSKESIVIASKKGIRDSEFKLFNGSEIPFPNNTFSVLCIANVLHHTGRKDHEAILQECFRVLRPSGSIFIFEHNPLNPFTRRIVKERNYALDIEMVSIHLFYFAFLFLTCGVKNEFEGFIPF